MGVLDIVQHIPGNNISSGLVALRDMQAPQSTIFSSLITSICLHEESPSDGSCKIQRNLQSNLAWKIMHSVSS